jgi:hypothetical protein
VAALADEVQVELAHRRQVPVRVVEQPTVDLDAVVLDGPGTVASKMPSSMTRVMGYRVPSTTAVTSRAPRRSVRMTVPSGSGWRPRIACGSWAGPTMISVTMRVPLRWTVKMWAGSPYGSRRTALC